MADAGEAQRKRAEARQRRRDGSGDDAQPDDGDGLDLLAAVKRAATAAAVGATVAAAKAAATRPAPEPEPDDDETDEPAEERPETHAEEEPEPAPAPRPRPEPQREPDVAGAGLDDVRSVVERAREVLLSLQGRPIDSVSGVERTPRGWTVQLEVVELERIPHTTDVLATYELALDEDARLVRYARTRRYHRSQAGDREAT
jgi:hypothetical protein